MGGLSSGPERVALPLGQGRDELDAELPLREGEGIDVRHPQNVGVEGQALGWVGNPDHGLLPRGPASDDGRRGGRGGGRHGARNEAALPTSGDGCPSDSDGREGRRAFRCGSKR